MLSTGRQRGFALVEALVIGTVVALVVGITIITLTATTAQRTSRKLCQKEAQTFQAAVKKYQERDNEHRWPGDPKQRDINLVVDDLIATKLIPRSGPDYLNGIERLPRTDDPGWLYDFDHHTTFSGGCR